MKFEITPEIARIHAHICGDGYVSLWNEKRSPGTLIKHPRRKLERKIAVMVYTNDCEELINEFVADMAKAFSRKTTVLGQKHKEARVRGARRFINLLELDGKNSYNWSIPDFIMNADEIIICNWLRAFFDDEGWIDIKGRVGVCSTNKEGLLQVSQLIERLQIKHSFRTYIRPQYTTGSVNNIYIFQKSNKRFYERINFKHPKKKQRLEYGVGGI